MPAWCPCPCAWKTTARVTAHPASPASRTPEHGITAASHRLRGTHRHRRAAAAHDAHALQVRGLPTAAADDRSSARLPTQAAAVHEGGPASDCASRKHCWLRWHGPPPRASGGGVLFRGRRSRGCAAARDTTHAGTQECSSRSAWKATACMQAAPWGTGWYRGRSGACAAAPHPPGRTRPVSPPCSAGCGAASSSRGRR